MTNDRVDRALVADRLMVLSEAEAIAADLAALEQRRGHHRGIDDLRARVQQVRVAVLAQLLAALLAVEGGETVN